MSTTPSGGHLYSTGQQLRLSVLVPYTYPMDLIMYSISRRSHAREREDRRKEDETRKRRTHTHNSHPCAITQPIDEMEKGRKGGAKPEEPHNNQHTQHSHSVMWVSLKCGTNGLHKQPQPTRPYLRPLLKKLLCYSQTACCTRAAAACWV